MGLWPEAGGSVWGDALYEACRSAQGSYDLSTLPEIGLDCATGKGDDFHAIHGRWGPVSVHHETANTMDPLRICWRTKEVCQLLADLANRHRDPAAEPVDPRKLLVKIDDDGTGNAVRAMLWADGYAAYPVGAGTVAGDPEKYPRRRDELWFQVAERAKLGQVCLGRLDRPTQRRLKQQLMAPTWDLDPAGRRKVEPKDDTKEKLGRSPDDADAFNLAYLTVASYDIPSVPEQERRSLEPRGHYESAATRRGLHGRR